MGLIERQALVAAIAPPLDPALAQQLIDEFVSAERRYVQNDWQPAELNGARFAELLALTLYHQDSGNLSPTKDFSDCCEYVEDDPQKGGRKHLVVPRQDALHVVKVLRTIYKLRNQRGAVHISPHYSANQMDAKLVIECVRWCMNETLRIFWKKNDQEAVAKAIQEILQFEVPCIGKYGDTLLVHHTDLTTEQELLLLLHHAGVGGMSRKDLGKHAMRASSSVTEALQRLCSTDLRHVLLTGDRYVLTAPGSKHVRESLADKFLNP